MEAEVSDTASHSSPSQPRVPDSRLFAGTALRKHDLAAEPAARLADQQEPEDGDESDDYDISTLALWPVFAMITIAFGVMVATLWYGPKMVLQEILTHLVPKRPTVWHMYAIYLAIVCCITTGIPVLLMLLPVPTMMFGFAKGYIITFLALMSAALLSFIIGRYIAQRPVRRFLKGRRFQRCMRLLSVLEDDEEQSMQLLILYRFLTIPMSMRNYGPSILRVPMMTLVLSAIPHSLWSACVFATAGTALKGPAQVLRDGHALAWRTPHWQQIAGLGVACLSMVLFSWIAWKAYMRKVEDDEKCAVNASSALKGTEEGVHYGTNADGTTVVIRTSDF